MHFEPSLGASAELSKVNSCVLQQQRTLLPKLKTSLKIRVTWKDLKVNQADEQQKIETDIHNIVPYRGRKKQNTYTSN